MKTPTAPAPSKSRASIILILLVFLGLMALIVVSNNLALRHLDRSLRLIEQKQMRKAGVPVKVNRPSK
ncbi:MAG TPA: hypothetical protein VGR14_21165 [Verrucomicrobiae bacterium]|jgi:hypothetical protein|nr:hypothetical protein [Verrucomicrobiae bacterium]